MATLKLLPNSLNSYEAAHKLLSGSKYYDPDMWLKSARHEQLDLYMTTLLNEDKISEDILKQDYNFDFGTSDNKLAALQNELFADRTTLKERQRVVTDETGKPILKDGEYQYQTYQTTDYDYYKSVIKSMADKNYNDYLLQQERDRKNAAPALEQFFNTVGTTVVSAADQVVRFFEDLISYGIGVGEWIGSGFDADAFVEGVANNDVRNVLGDMHEWVENYERNYSWFRDVDGSYQNGGEFVVGLVDSLAYMLPTLLISKGIGAIGGSIGGTAGATFAKVGGYVTQGIFYTAVTSGNVKEMYTTFANEGRSVTAQSILANAHLKSIAQWAIEIGLSKMLGVTQFDKNVFNRGVGKATTNASGLASNSLTKSGAIRIVKDAVQEGLEEAFQDTSDFFVDKFFSWFVDENYGHISNWNLEDILLSFILGAAMSVAGSGLGIVTAKDVYTGETKTDKKGNKIDKKVNKLAAWEYGINVDSFVNNFNEIQKEGQRLSKLVADGTLKEDDVKIKNYQTALKEMYTSARLISNIYQHVGAEKIAKANEILDYATNGIRAGIWSIKDQFKQIRLAAERLFAEGFSSNEVLTAQEQAAAIEQIEKAELQNIVATIERGEDGSVEIPQDLQSGLEQIFKKDKNVKKAIVTEYGSKPLLIKDVIFAPLNLVKNADGSLIYDTIAEQTLVEKTMDGQFKISLDSILNLYKQVSGFDDATMEEAIYNMYFNDSFFRVLLINANKDMYQLLSSLLTIEKNSVSKDFRDERYLHKIGIVTTFMTNALTEYCINQQNADVDLDIFDTATKTKIRAARWCKDLFNRVVKGDKDGKAPKLSEDDVRVLTNRINGLPINETEKKRIFSHINSNYVQTRRNAMVRIDNEYNNVFTTPYNGEVYQPNTGVANQVFNNFLIEAGLTIQTVVSRDALTEQDIKAIEANIGEANEENILKYRNLQFKSYCNNKYTFGATYHKDKYKVAVFDVNGKQVGFGAYATNIEAIKSGENIDERTFIKPGKKNNAEIRKLLNSDIDIATASYLSINDVINNPEYLTVDLQNEIKAVYGDLNPDNVFLYFRKYFLAKNKNLTVTINQNGDYIFADVTPMLGILKKGTFDINETTKIEDLVKPKYLLGRLKHLKIEFTNKENEVAFYRFKYKQKIGDIEMVLPDNTIVINKSLIKSDPDLLRFAFIHELQHAMQTETKLNLGLSNAWIKEISSIKRKQIIEDVKNHRPDLFEGIDDKVKIEEIVSDFVYHTTGESIAYGMEGSEKMDFYPTLVTSKNGKLTLVLPWGTEYVLHGDYVSLTATRATYDKKYDEIRDRIEDTLLPYSPDKVQKGFVFPDGHIGFFNPSQVHMDVLKSLLEGTSDYITAFEFLTSTIDITTDVFDFNTREYKIGNFGKYTIRLRNDYNYKQKDTVIKFIERCMSDGKVVELWQWSGNAHVSTNDLSKYESAEDMYNKFLKRYNVTPTLKYPYGHHTINDVQIDKLMTYLSKYKLKNLSDLDECNSFAIDSIGNVYVFKSKQDFTWDTLLAELGKDFNDTLYDFFSYSLVEFYHDVDMNFYADSSNWYGFTELQAESLIKIRQYLNDSSMDIYIDNWKAKKSAEALVAIFKLDYNKVFEYGLEVLDNYYIIEDSQFLERQGYILDAIDSDYVSEVTRTNEEVYNESRLGRMDFAAGTSVKSTAKADKTAKANKSAEIRKANKEAYKKLVAKENKTGVSRHISKSMAKGNNLMYFTAKYKQLEMDPNFADFIVETTGKRGIDKWITDRISGDLKGTLTMNELLHYFSTAENMSDETFKLINKCIFKNKRIKTLKELDELWEVKAAEYYAARAMLRQSEWGKSLLELDRTFTETEFDKIVGMIRNDKDMAPIFDEIVSRYTSYKGGTVNFNKGYSRKVWMRHFDGSITRAAYAASLSKFVPALGFKTSTGIRTGSLDDSDSDGLSLNDRLSDPYALLAFEAVEDGDYELERVEKTKELIRRQAMILTERYSTKAETITEYSEIVQKKLKAFADELKSYDDEKFERAYEAANKRDEKELKQMMQEYVKELGPKAARSKALSELAERELNAENKFRDLLKQTLDDDKYYGQGYKARIKGKLRTIKSNISEQERKRILKTYDEILDEKLNIKRSAIYQNPEVKATRKLKYKSKEELEKLFNQITELANSVKIGATKSVELQKIYDKWQKDVAKLEKEKAEIIANKTNNRYEIQNVVVHLDGQLEMPDTLKRVFNTTFKYAQKSHIHNLEGVSEYHLRMRMKDFLREHAEELQAWTQEEVNEIIDFFTHTSINPISGANISRSYSAIEIYVLTYLLRGNATAQFSLSDDQLRTVTTYLEAKVSKAGTDLEVWREAKKKIDPEKELIQSIAKSNKIDFSEASIAKLVKATKKLTEIKNTKSDEFKQAAAHLANVKREMYEEGVKNYKGKKRNFFDQLVTFEAAAMLSGPGTWIKNWASNITVKNTNKFIDLFIAKTSSKQNVSVKQYKIAGTVISDNVAAFIKNTFETKIGDGKLTLLDLISEDFSKYDTRRLKRGDDELSPITTVIRNAIQSDIYGKVHSGKFGKGKDSRIWYDKIIGFVFKQLSDRKFVQSAAMTYFGKILTEDNIDVSKGLSDKEILERLGQAFVLAAHDYMHKANFLTSLDEMIRKAASPGAYFLWKQVAPFMATGWNWFVEGLKFSPLGLANSIVRYAKLENSIEKAERKLQQGKQVPDSRFTEYLIKRDIGKGVLGTVGFIFGILAFAFGWARIDEEDDKYKLYVGENVSVDISDIFGTQGIFLGMTTAAVFAEIFNKDDDANDVTSAFVTLLDYMFMDSALADAFNLFRYNDSTGEWLTYFPTKVANMFIPKLLSTLSDVVNVYDVQLSEGFKGKIDKFFIKMLPFLASFYPKKYDIYTGELQLTYKAEFITNLWNKLLPLKVYPYDISDTEMTAFELGVRKNELTGKYEIAGEKIQLNATNRAKLNEYYGKLNKTALDKLMSSKSKYKVYNEEKNKYEELTFAKMNEKQKASVITRIMDNNAGYAKVYILTNNGYKYYASESEYKTLKSLGISCYKATDTKKGFYKS